MSKGTLFDILPSALKHPLPWRQRMTMLVDLARGLQFLHKSGLVHGRVTSQAIVVDDEYRARLSDFGLGTV